LSKLEITESVPSKVSYQIREIRQKYIVVYIKDERIEMSSQQCAKSQVGFNLTEMNPANEL